MNLIETQQLMIGYGNKPLLDKINFALKPQQICCLLGANGGGEKYVLKNFNLVATCNLMGKFSFKIDRLLHILPLN